MEKYAKLMKGLEMCAGPDCCKDACPYYGETGGGKTCRAWLLNDAAAAIANEEAGSETLQELLHNTEAERDKLAAEVDDLEAAANTLRAERDGLALGMETMKENYDIMRMRAQVQQNEINALMSKIGKQEDKIDQPSAISDDLAKQIGELVAHANYQQGRADALAAIVERCSFGGGCCHE